jgi:predicted enzyme related to lactoylglutathione lyase
MTTQIGKTYWFDLPAVNMEDARSFYEGLFNWKFLRLSDEVVSDYWVIQVGEELIGGLRKMPVKSGEGSSPVLYFTVDDLNRYRDRIKELGGKLEGGMISLGKKRGAYQWFRDREKNLLALWAPEKETL